MLMFMLNVMILLIFMMLMIISFLISKKKSNDWEKMSPFECGFNLMNSPRNPFSLSFFLISVIFLIFDIEIIMLIPFILNIFLINLMTWLMLILIFLIILIWGLFHEWFLGSLNWL